MSQRRRSGLRCAVLGVLALVVIIGLLTEHLWWAVGVAVLAAAWLTISFVRTSRALDAELGRSNARTAAAERKKHARISSGDRTEPRSGDTPGQAHGPSGSATAGEE